MRVSETTARRPPWARACYGVWRPATGVEAGQLRPRHWGEGEIRGPVHLYREGLLLRVFRRSLASGTVLDAGCGSGSLALALARLGYAVDAVDQSAEFVERVAQRAGAEGLEHHLRVRLGSVTALEYADGSFDGLACGEVLEHLRPEEGGDAAAVAQFYRVLRHGAPCVVSVPLNPRLWDHSDEWAGHVKRYTRDGLVRLFEAGGFAVERVCSWGFPLGRLYHRLLFGPWLRRSGGGEGRSRVAGHGRLVALAARVMRFDEVFGRWPWGRGLVLLARRRGRGEGRW